MTEPQISAALLPAPARIPFRAGFLAGDLGDLSTVRLAGSRCNACGIALLGERHRCENCSSKDVSHVVFAAGGTVFTYTIQRYPPPPPNAVPVPWTPRPLAWIDIDEDGPRIMAVVNCAPEAVSIDMPVLLRCDVGWQDGTGSDVVCFSFDSVDPEQIP